MVGKEKATAKLPRKAGAGGGEALAPHGTLSSTTGAHLQSSEGPALFFWEAGV